MIHDVKLDTKYDIILHKFSQEPSTSSKYDCILDELLFMLEAKNWDTAQEWHIILIHDVTFDTKDDSIIQISSQDLSTFPQVLLCSWFTFNHARELKFGIQLNNDI